MRKILLSIITIILFSLKAIAFDEPNYPIYQYDSANNKIAVIISLKQARMMDNDYDILELLGKAKIGCDSLSSSYQIVIKSQDKVIASQDVKILELENLDNTNKDIILNLNEQIAKYIQDEIKSQGIISNKDSEITQLNKDIFKLKTKNIIGFTAVGVTGGAFFAILVTSFVKGWIKVK